MIIEIIFMIGGTPKKYDVDGTYTKGGFFCLRIGDELIKYPMGDIFLVRYKHGHRWGCREHLNQLKGDVPK